MCKICGFNTKNLIINELSYHKCINCGFLYKDEKHILSSESEFDRYKLHNNNDENYYLYQENFAKSIEDYLSGNVLDFGCGDNHVLASILKEKGFNSFYYDLYFYPENDVFNNIFDVIILEEVIEHLEQPLIVLKKITKVLSDNGKFIIRTNLLKDSINLNSWWYLRDQTHISFFTYESFKICSQLLGFEIIYCNDKDLIIMKRV